MSSVSTTDRDELSAPRKWYVRYSWPFLPLLCSTALLTLAFAPVGQFYLAWVGLAPWLLFVRTVGSQRAAFFWSWIGGTLFFSANMWWMANISVPGMIALTVYCGLYWGFAALLIRGLGMLDWPNHNDNTSRKFSASLRAIASVVCVAVVWVTFEWFRGNLMTGLPWLFMGHTQSPVLALCQVADITSTYGVSFWLVMFNALIAVAVLNRRHLLRVLPAAIFVVAVIAGIAGYGVFRLQQTDALTSPGPIVAVVQPSYPQSNDGSKGAPISKRLSFHLRSTETVIQEQPPLDLAVWSETMMPPINHQTLEEMDQETAKDNQPRWPRVVYQELRELCLRHHIALLTGAEYEAKWSMQERGGEKVPMGSDRRNSAFFFDRTGAMDDSIGKRYDKNHLVPWGEFIPFKYSVPFLYHLFVLLGPQYYSDYELQSGADNGLTVFELSDVSGHVWRFVTPICFEDIDSQICARMVCPTDGTDRKRADFLVNITNDGWFAANENAQHLQAAVFRSIENRLPTARSVNTGISGFIDSAGRTSGLIPARTEGTSIGQLKLDPRVTFYTRRGDAFAFTCIAGSALMAVMGMWRKLRVAR